MLGAGGHNPPSPKRQRGKARRSSLALRAWTSLAAGGLVRWLSVTSPALVRCLRAQPACPGEVGPPGPSCFAFPERSTGAGHPARKRRGSDVFSLFPKVALRWTGGIVDREPERFFDT